MNKYIKYIPWLILIIVFFLFLRQCQSPNPKPVYIEIEKKVFIPKIYHVFDTIEKPIPVYRSSKEIDSTYYKEYLSLKDSVKKDLMLRYAISINEYNQNFEDTLQVIKVYSKTRGKLLKQTVEYTTKPYYITVKDSFEVKKRTSVSFGAEIGIPTNSNTTTSPILKGNVIITNKRGNSTSISYDTQGNAWFGKTWKIKLRKNKR